jgi:hypothetical protein
MRCASRLALAAIVLLASGPAVCQTSFGAASGSLEFNGARLGMSLSEWKLMPRAEGSPADVTATCSDEAVPDSASRVKFSTSAPAPPLVVCSYAARLGGYMLSEDLPLTKTYFARNPKYYFLSGRLAKIEFRSSINAFGDLVAVFEAKFGQESQTIRDQIRTPFGLKLPRVQKIWRLPDGLVRIVDPSASLDQLVVDFTGPVSSRPTPAG